MRRLITAAVVSALVTPSGVVRAQNAAPPYWLDSSPQGHIPGTSPAMPSYTQDANGAAFQGVATITPGMPVSAARSIGFVVTTGGTVTFTLADGSTITLTLAVSPQLQTLPFAVTNVALGTAAGSFWSLK